MTAALCSGSKSSQNIERYHKIKSLPPSSVEFIVDSVVTAPDFMLFVPKKSVVAGVAGVVFSPGQMKKCKKYFFNNSLENSSCSNLQIINVDQLTIFLPGFSPRG